MSLSKTLVFARKANASKSLSVSRIPASLLISRQFQGLGSGFTPNEPKAKLPPASSVYSNSEWSVHSYYTEGDELDVNWSMVRDGVCNTKLAFRNARLPLITNRLSSKPEGNKLEVANPPHTGEYTIEEAGENIELETFDTMCGNQKNYLSSGLDLFVEDVGLGAHYSSRVGVRVISECPAYALIARNLHIPLPARRVEQGARFDGWNLSPRWKPKVPIAIWDETSQNFVFEDPNVPKKGQRPILVLIGGDSSTVALEFIQANKKLVGSNVIIGKKAPVRGFIEAVGLASYVLINAQQPTAIALPSASYTKGATTAVVVGADDSVVSTLYEKGTIYGAYHNIITKEGVSALWNGVIGPSKGHSGASPFVTNGGLAVIPAPPDNLVHPAKTLAFYEKGATKRKLSEEEAVNKLVALTDESKRAFAAELVKDMDLVLVGTASAASSLL